MMFVTFSSLQTSNTPTPLPLAYLYLYSFSFLFLILNLFFPIMMSFCKKSVHSFLGLTYSNIDTTTTTSSNIHHEKKLIPPWKLSQTTGGLGTLVTTTDDNTIRRRSPKVLESTAPFNKSLSSSPPKKDPGRGIGFIDDIGGGVDGLMSCTESLGFESSDERRVDDDDDIDNAAAEDELTLTNRTWSTEKAKCRGKRTGRQVKKFPPPLSSLNKNGQPSFFLRPVRKDGRLELTEVRIHRPEILRAYREDGRLRLHLIKDYDDIEEEEEENEVITEEEEEEEEGDEISNGDDQEMKFPVSGGEGLGRCHELLNHHHHNHHQHHLHVWRQLCVTTR